MEFDFLLLLTGDVVKSSFLPKWDHEAAMLGACPKSNAWQFFYKVSFFFIGFYVLAGQKSLKSIRGQEVTFPQQVL